MTPVQTSRRVCVRTSRSPVSLPLAPSHSLSLLTYTHTQRYRSEIGSLPENSSGSSESGGGGSLPSVAGVTRPYTSPLPPAAVLAFSQSWGGSGHRSTSAQGPEM